MLPRATLLVMAAALAAAAPPFAAAGEPIDARLEHLAGGKLRLSELRGRPVLLDLWATWCLPCQEQSRILHELAAELESRGIAVLAVNVGESGKVAQAFVAEHPGDFPVVLDRQQALAAVLDVGELPALALLDADGAVAGVRLGLTQRADVLDLLAAVAP